MAGIGRNITVELDNLRYEIVADGSKWEEATHRGANTDAQMRAAGFIQMQERYASIIKKPFSEVAANLSDLYVVKAQSGGSNRG